MSEQTLIVNAHILDGCGAQARPADVLVADGLIVGVDLPDAIPSDGREVLDACGMTIAPGFIDVHSHDDNVPFMRKDDSAKVMQGITTEIVGNCGFSLAPRVAATASQFESYLRRTFPELPWSWTTFAELLAATDALGYVTNYVPLVGHNSLRIAALGMSDSAPDADKARMMARLLDEALESGAFGLSSGLVYPPGVFATTSELIALASRLPTGRPYVTHMRGEGTQLFASIEEALSIGRRGNCSLHVSHLKVLDRANWGRMPEALSRLDRARDDGYDVRQDVYPYTAGSTMLTATLPPWFQGGGDKGVLDRLRDPSSLSRLRNDLGRDDGTWQNSVYGSGWGAIVVASTASHNFEGCSILQIAEDQAVEPLDALVEVLVQERLQATMVVHSMAEDDLRDALRHNLTMIGTDGLPPGTGGRPHPRRYGTFPRVLGRYVRDLSDVDLPEAIRRMTSLPADNFGLTDRGRIALGMAADLVAFDPVSITDTADYDNPTSTPRGIELVMINGETIVQNGQRVGGRAGKRLAPPN